jgi:hypothetical protein
MKNVLLTKEQFDILIEAYYELADVVMSAPNLKPCWDQVAELDSLVEPIIEYVEGTPGGKA